MPRVKRVNQPIALPNNRILIGLVPFSMASEIQDDDDDSIARLIVLMDGTRTVDEICLAFALTHHGVDESSVRDAIDGLINAGFVEDAGAPLPENLTPGDVARYDGARHFFGWIDGSPRSSPYLVQSKIKQGSVALLGVGGTGSAVAAGLVASGIGELRIADYDRVEEPNLPRQLLYDENDVGELKVERAVSRLRAMNSRVKVTGEAIKVGCVDDIAALMSGADVFVLCADEPLPDLAYWTNEAAIRSGTPWFMSFYTGAMSGLGSFIPGQTGCWACLQQEENRLEHRAFGRPLLETRPNAVIAANANVSGHLCALEVLTHLGGLRHQTRGRMFLFTYAFWDSSYFIDVPHFNDCSACGATPP